MPSRTRTQSESGRVSATSGLNKQEPKVIEQSLPPVLTDGTRVCIEVGTTEEISKFNFARVSVRVEFPTTKDNVDSAGREAYALADRLHSDLSQEFVNGPQTEGGS